MERMHGCCVLAEHACGMHVWAFQGQCVGKARLWSRLAAQPAWLCGADAGPVQHRLPRCQIYQEARERFFMKISHGWLAVITCWQPGYGSALLARVHRHLTCYDRCDCIHLDGGLVACCAAESSAARCVTHMLRGLQWRRRCMFTYGACAQQSLAVVWPAAYLTVLAAVGVLQLCGWSRGCWLCFC